MFILGCILAFGIVMAPRVILVLAWLFSARWDVVWQNGWLLPLLGILFLPYTTVMYMLAWSPGGIQGWEWMWVVLGLMLDLIKWATVAQNRSNLPYSQSPAKPPANIAM